MKQAAAFSDRERIARISEKIPSLIVVYNIQTGEYIYVNDMVRSFLGYTPDDFYKGGMQFATSLVHPDDLDRIMTQNEKALRSANDRDSFQKMSSSRTTFEYRMRHKNGSWIWLHSDGVVFDRDKKGKVLHVLNISLDITKRKENEIEQILRRIEVETTLKNRLEQQAAMAELGVLALSGKTLPEILQEAVEKIHTILGGDYTTILEYLPDEKMMLFKAGVGWHEDVIADKTRVAAGKRSHAGYTLLMKRPVIIKDIAREKRFQISSPLADHPATSGLSCVISGKDSPYGVLSVHTKTFRAFTKDDTIFLQSVANLLALTIERKQHQKALEQAFAQLSRLKYAIDQSSIVAITDSEGVIKYINKKFVEISKYSSEELIGETHRIINSRYHPSAFFVALWKTIKNGNVWHGEIRNRAKDGSYYWVDTTIIPLKNEKGEIEEFIAIRNDITERKKLEKQKDEFIAMASHELKTPLTSLKAYAQLIKNRFKKAGDTSSVMLLEKIDTQIDKLTILIADLLDVSKMQHGKLQFQKSYFDFNDLILEVTEAIQWTSKKQKLLRILARSKLIFGDRERLGQVITNFITNAIKYSPRSSSIIVKTDIEKNNILLSVQDFGIGIAKNQQSRIFEQYFRVDETIQLGYSGLGLGLYISSEIIKRHGGRIWVESEEGKGSTFSFAIPFEPKP